MLKSVVSKVAWVGRTASMVFGLALVLALLFGVASMAMGATGGNFLLGKKNVADAISTLVKQGPGPALSLVVEANQPPLRVNSAARVANLNADKVDGLEGASFVQGGGAIHHFGPVNMASLSGSTDIQELIVVGPYHIRGACGPLNFNGGTITQLLVDETARPYSGGWQVYGDQDRSYPQRTDAQLDIIRNNSSTAVAMDTATGSVVSHQAANSQIIFNLYQQRNADSAGNVSCTFGGYVVDG